MAPTYSTAGINAKLNGLSTTLGGGFMKLLAGGTVVCTLTLASPAGTVGAGVLTFTAGALMANAAATGTITSVQMTDSGGNLLVSDISVGAPGSGADVIISNGLGTTLVTIGQTVQVLSVQIVGS